MKMTESWLQSAKPKAESYDKTVTNRKGFMVRIHPSGTISFRFRYSRAGKTFPMTLGEYGEQGLSLQEATDMHDLARKELALGLDPIEEREKRQRALEQARADRAAAGTVAHIVDQFMHRRIRAERWDEATRGWVRDAKSKIKPRKRPEKAWEMLKRDLVDKIGTQKAADVTTEQLIDLLDKIVDRGAPVLANRTYEIFKQCFSFASAKRLIKGSPMDGVERPGGTETSRERTLKPDEIRTFWKQIDTAKMEPKSRLALKILLVTGQRRGEITKAFWQDIDFDQCIWKIPKDLAKNGKEHLVPLSPMAIQLFRELHLITGKGVRAMPHHRCKLKPGEPCVETALSAAIYKNRKHFGIDAFTTHDLRRTASTTMTKIGIKRLFVEKVLNHTLGDVAEIYDRNDYFPEKVDALNRWADHLQDILANRPPKVVPIRKSEQAAA
ncbi:MAG: tyrosine-type recombinase/integrase [Pseudomonadota bacterium]|nr:tyrosine-type recombinase/integrase [Pseudomonadota bacterium]